jgi:hypothetical protein
MASAASQDINRDHSPTRPNTPPRSRGLAGVASGGIGDGREWRSVGKHPSLEMKHTVEDRLMIATNISYLPFRAFLHRSRDKIVCYSQMIREITSSGQNQSDRALVITDVHLYVIQMPSGAMFAPPSTGGCFALTDFSKMSLVTGTQHCLFQFVGATIAMRFSSAKDAQRCGNVIFSLTAVPVEAIAPNELGSHIPPGLTVTVIQGITTRHLSRTRKPRRYLRPRRRESPRQHRPPSRGVLRPWTTCSASYSNRVRITHTNHCIPKPACRPSRQQQSLVFRVLPKRGMLRRRPYVGAKARIVRTPENTADMVLSTGSLMWITPNRMRKAQAVSASSILGPCGARFSAGPTCNHAIRQSHGFTVAPSKSR